MNRSVPLLVLLALALAVAGCTSGARPPGQTRAVTPVSPAQLSDGSMVKAVSRSPDARMRPGGDPHVVRVFGPEGPDSALFYGYRRVEDERCRRWAAGLRRAAEDVKVKDEGARIAGADFGDAQGRAVGVALLVAQPSMLDQLAGGDPQECSGTWAEDHGERIRVRVAEVPAEPLGDRARAFRVWEPGKAATWFKEVRFGPYLLQVAHVGDVFHRTPPDPITAQKLDKITGQAYRKAREVLDNAPTVSAAPSSPLPASQFATEAPGGDLDARLREAMLPGFRGARSDPSELLPTSAQGGWGPGISDERWMKKVSYVGMDRGDPCTAYAEGLWAAAANAPGSHDRPSQIGINALYRPDGFFTAELLLWAAPPLMESLTEPAPPGRCRSFTHTINGTKTTMKVAPVKAAPVAEASWAYRITTSGDAPSYVKWFRFGPYLAEVRIGTVGTKPNDDITLATLDEAAKAAYTRALQSLT